MKINVERRTNSDRQRFFNGSFKESFDFLITATTGPDIVTGTLTNSQGGNLTMQFSDGLTILNVSGDGDIILSEGTNTTPKTNYIYIPISTKVLTLSESGWPAEEHIKISFSFLPSATEINAEGGGFINQNWNDHLMSTDNQGHMLHMAQNMRIGPAQYFSGMDPNGLDQDTLTSYFNVVGAAAYFKMTSGVAFQLHEHSTPAFDSEQAADEMHAVNWFGDSYHAFNDLTDIQADSTGSSLSNKYFNIFFFAVANKTGEYSPVMMKLPSGSYVSAVSAENDVDSFDDLTMPREFALDSSTGVRICRITLRWTGGFGTLNHISTTDLRTGGLVAGGGAIGGGTSFADNQFNIFDEADVTKIMNFDVGTYVPTGTTNTYQFPSAGGILALTSQTDGTITVGDITDIATTYLKLDCSNDPLTEDLEILKNFVIPVTTSTEGQITQGGVRIFHTFVPTQQAPSAKNIFIGENSGNFNLDNTAQSFHGTGNVGVGFNTLDALTTGYYNMGIGTRALSGITDGNSNVAIGHQAGLSITEGSSNISLGRDAGVFITTGVRNISIGHSSGRGIITSSENTAIGYHAMQSSSDVASVIAIGAYAGKYEDTTRRLTIDYSDRGDIATARTEAILYGIMAPAPADQDLFINADLFLRADARKIFLGLGDDAYITYNEFRSNLEIQTDNVGSGGLTINQTTSSGNTFEFANDGTMIMNERGSAGGGIIRQNAKVRSDIIFTVHEMGLDRGQGVGGAGMGLKWLMILENGAGARHDAGGITLEWVDATVDVEDSKMSFETYSGGSACNALILNGCDAEIGASGTGTLDVNGGNIRALRTEVNDYTALPTDYTILADATSNTVDITLPATPNQGQIFNIFCTNSTFTCQVLRNGKNINGAAADRTLTVNQSETYQYDSTFGWAII